MCPGPSADPQVRGEAADDNPTAPGRETAARPADYLAFEDDRGEVAKMAVIRPSVPPEAPRDDQAAVDDPTSALRRDEPELTVTRQYDPSRRASAALESPKGHDAGDASDLDEDPKTLDRALADLSPRDETPLSFDGETLAQVRPRPLGEAEPATLPRREETPRIAPPRKFNDQTGTTIRRDALPPPPLVAPAGRELRPTDERAEPSTVAWIGPVVEPAPTPLMLPPLDATPPPAPAVQTPLTMTSGAEDKATRVSVLLPMRRPTPFPEDRAASGVQLQRAFVFVSGTVLIAAIVFAVLRPRHPGPSSMTASSPPAAVTPVRMTPMDLPPAVATPPVATLMQESPPATTAAPAAPTPATKGPEVAKRRPRPRPVIPVRREQ